MADGAGGRGGRCVYRADERTGGWPLTRRSGGRADERTGGPGEKAADDRADGGGKGADSRADGWIGPSTRGRADKRLGGRADERSGGRADERTGRSGPKEPRLGRTG